MTWQKGKNPHGDGPDKLAGIERLCDPNPHERCVIYYVEALNNTIIDYLDSLRKSNLTAYTRIVSTLDKITTTPDYVLNNRDRFRPLNKEHGIFELKFRFVNIRIFVIRYSHYQLVLTHGCNKPPKKSLKGEIKKTINIKKKYIDSYDDKKKDKEKG